MKFCLFHAALTLILSAACCLHIFLNDLVHGIPLFLHILHQLELCPAAVEIMVFPVNLEIVIALQIIGEKAHSAFKSHNLGADGHQEDLLFRELSGASLEKAFDIHFIEVHITEDFVQIRLVFIGGACAETDGVAEIIHRKSRHDGIQIDNTDSFAGLVVDHDIVQLCVVVGDTKRDLFFGKQFVKDAGKFLVGKDKFNLSLYRGGTAADILLYSFF